MAKLEPNFGNTNTTPPLSAPDQPDIHGAFGDSAPGTPVPTLSNTPIPAPVAEPLQQPSQVIDSTFDVLHWRDAARNPAYAQPDYSYERDYAPAYQFGHSERIHNPPPALFDDIAADLEGRWDEFKQTSRLTWAQAKVAIKEAWDYVTE